MSIVHFQFAAEDRHALFEYARRWILPGSGIGDSGLYEWLLRDMAASLEDAVEMSARRPSRIVEGEWLMMSSRASLYPKRRRPLSYEMLLQRCRPQFPFQTDDVPLEVSGVPPWLDRVIVVAWAAIQQQASE